MSHPCPARNHDWPADREAVTFLVLTRPDPRGRQDFYALFWREDVRQGLAFFGRSLDEQVRAARRKGCVVDVVERIDIARAA